MNTKKNNLFTFIEIYLFEKTFKRLEVSEEEPWSPNYHKNANNNSINHDIYIHVL